MVEVILLGILWVLLQIWAKMDRSRASFAHMLARIAFIAFCVAIFVEVAYLTIIFLGLQPQTLAAKYQ